MGFGRGFLSMIPGNRKTTTNACVQLRKGVCEK